MSERKEGRFKIKKITPLSEISDNTQLPESDLCFQDADCIMQFSFEQGEDLKEEVIPGIFTISDENGLKLKTIEFRDRHLFTSATNTEVILKEAHTFFSKLHVYEELGEAKARKILLYSAPGLGKTATISYYSQKAIEEDPGTIVVVWPTGSISSDDMLEFMSRRITYSSECTRMILVVEDIGGGEREGNGSARAVDSALLDILDGVRDVFKLPTLVIATTNYPENLLSALADRPGRFDLLMELNPPSKEERIAITEFIAKRLLTDEEKQSLSQKDAKDFSIAHLKEIIIRSRLHDKTISQVVEEIIAHRKKFNNNFDKKSDVGFGKS